MKEWRLQKEKHCECSAFLFGGATPSSNRALSPQAAESGPHSPLGDRQARLQGGERANIRAKREIPRIYYNASDKKDANRHFLAKDRELTFH